MKNYTAPEPRSAVPSAWSLVTNRAAQDAPRQSKANPGRSKGRRYPEESRNAPAIVRRRRQESLIRLDVMQKAQERYAYFIANPEAKLSRVKATGEMVSFVREGGRFTGVKVVF